MLLDDCAAHREQAVMVLEGRVADQALAAEQVRRHRVADPFGRVGCRRRDDLAEPVERRTLVGVLPREILLHPRGLLHPSSSGGGSAFRRSMYAISSASMSASMPGSS